ncbi:MAG: hypothetical protein AAGA90_20520 [Actinomycetota bacterium]
MSDRVAPDRDQDRIWFVRLEGGKRVHIKADRQTVRRPSQIPFANVGVSDTLCGRRRYDPWGGTNDFEDDELCFTCMDRLTPDERSDLFLQRTVDDSS